MDDRKNDIRRLESLLDFIAESIHAASEDDILETLRENGRNPDSVAAGVRSLIAGTVKKQRRQRLGVARQAYERVNEWLTTLVSAIHIPKDRVTMARMIEQLLTDAETSPSLTLAFRKVTGVSDDDLSGMLVDFSALGMTNAQGAPTWTSRFYSPEELLTALGIAKPQDIDLEAIAYHCGAVVRYHHLDHCAARIVGTNERAIISVDPATSRGRQRFSIAHELGHWMLHRGKMAYACKEDDFSSPWERRQDSESRANQFAAELLMPRFIFKPAAENREMTLRTVGELAELFQTSMTATALRLVQLGSFPAMAICYGREGRRWFARGFDVPDAIWPHKELSHDTAAFELLFGNSRQARPLPSQANKWFSHRNAYRCSVVEDSIKVAEDCVLTLVWWKDKTQLSELAD